MHGETATMMRGICFEVAVAFAALKPMLDRMPFLKLELAYARFPAGARGPSPSCHVVLQNGRIHDAPSPTIPGPS